MENSGVGFQQEPSIFSFPTCPNRSWAKQSSIMGLGIFFSREYSNRGVNLNISINLVLRLIMCVELYLHDLTCLNNMEVN